MSKISKVVSVVALLVAGSIAGCTDPENEGDKAEFRSNPDVEDTVTDPASGASVTYRYWEVDDDTDAALAEIEIDWAPSSGNGPIYLEDTYLDVALNRDGSGRWVGTGTFTQPPQAFPCNHKSCNGTSCSNLAPNCNCFQGPQACGHGWCSGGGGFTPLVLNVTFF